MEIGKYEFTSQEEAQNLIETSGIQINNDVVEIGFIKTIDSTYDSNGVELAPSVFSNKYSVDVLWINQEHTDWSPFRIEVTDNGFHEFAGLSYQQYKIQSNV